jgi:hypothetical protein
VRDRRVGHRRRGVGLILDLFFIRPFVSLSKSSGASMKRSLGSMWSWTTVALVCAGASAHAEGFNELTGGPGLVEGLAVMNDLEPSATVAEPATRLSAYTFTTQARASTPAVDRSRSYGVADPFASSRAVFPLLVDDLTPNRVAVARPMTGRSVGARPSLPLARPESR